MTLPGDDAVVVRGGSGRDPALMLAGIQRMIEQGLPARISVFAQPYNPDTPAAEAVERVCRSASAPWGQVQVSTVRRLRAAGFELLDERDEDEAACHFHIGFPATVTLLETSRFIECFDEPVPNPIPRQERRRR